jgi:hypothetical protein
VERLLSGRSADTVVRVKGESGPFIAALAKRGIPARTAGADLHLVLPAGDTSSVFQAAFETRTQVRYLGRSVNTVEDLFLSLVDSPPSGAPA